LPEAKITCAQCRVGLLLCRDVGVHHHRAVLVIRERGHGQLKEALLVR
jgi:hypothetical protein